jgi:hypothetical protein
MEKIFDYKSATIHEIILDRWLELNLIEINFQNFIQNFSKFNPIKNSILKIPFLLVKFYLVQTTIKLKIMQMLNLDIVQSNLKDTQ